MNSKEALSNLRFDVSMSQDIIKRQIMKIKDLPNGTIVWYKNATILGVKGATLPKEFDDFNVEKIEGNDLDYQILAKRDRKGNYYKI